MNSRGKTFVTGLLGAFVVVAGCRAAGPPKGPKHVPSNTAEAETACPKERKRAQEAREALLGANDVALSARAAEAVLAHGGCEARAALALPEPQGTQDATLAGIRDLRVAVRDALGLFSEVRRYGDSASTRQAFIGDVELTIAFAERVEAVPSPTDLAPEEAPAFRAELSDAGQTLRQQAALTVEQAIADGVDAATREHLCRSLAAAGVVGSACDR